MLRAQSDHKDISEIGVPEPWRSSSPVESGESVESVERWSCIFMTEQNVEQIAL